MKLGEKAREKIRNKLDPYVKVWTYEEWNNMSKLDHLKIRLAQITYHNSLKKLFTIEFWKDLNKDEYSCIGEWFFFLQYRLFWIIEVEKDGKRYCL